MTGVNEGMVAKTQPTRMTFLLSSVLLLSPLWLTTARIVMIARTWL
jgi:hypothetical protein